MKSRLPTLLLGLSALGACASIPDPPEGRAIPTSADRHEIAVEQTSQEYRLAVAPGDNALAPDASGELAALAGNYLRYGHGALVLSAPAGGENEASARALAEQSRRFLVAVGVSHAAIASSTYDASGTKQEPVIVSFSRFEAHAPECAPLWEQDLAHQSNNQAWESFGCATQANLAAMVEDPSDLLRPRDMTARESGRRATVFEAYREGLPTGATRSEQEHAAVSDVGR
ncbi:MAG: CpaD family pilus assembly protein [Terricaulis sp.]